MNIEAITLGHISLGVAFVVALVKGIDFLTEKFKKPTTDLESRINDRLKSMEQDNKMTLKILFQLLQHEVTDDHVTDMAELYNELQTYIMK